METTEHSEVYRRREEQTLEALNLLATELEVCGHYDLALDCQESVTAVRNGNLALASSILARVESQENEEIYGFTKDWCYARDLALSRLAGLQAHLLGEAAGEDWT
ncbi:MAG: hypothetical protein JWM16_3573 [Verrucomicrobiales bacterium]|nr:hypothetical protein [Verrucomicrobiales bacterium]